VGWWKWQISRLWYNTTYTNMKKNKFIVGVVVLVAVLGLVWFFSKNPSGQQVSQVDATDTVKNFYDKWLVAVQKPASANPTKNTLSKSPILSKSLREKIATAQKDSNTTMDPVLCQTVVPEGIDTRNVYKNESEAQILITSKDKKVTNQALVKLNALNGGWYINDIECSLGEIAPEREFTFEKEGYLLKGSIPKPFNPKNWHLIFEENGKAGNVVPLIFNAESQCTSLEGAASVCKPDQFTEATKASIRGQMTERGAEVKRLIFVK
jgi:hypothetical protein